MNYLEGHLAFADGYMQTSLFQVSYSAYSRPSSFGKNITPTLWNMKPRPRKMWAAEIVLVVDWRMPPIPATFTRHVSVLDPAASE